MTTTSTSTSTTSSPQPPAGVWLKGDLHVHSEHSHDAARLGDDIGTIIRLAERAGLDFTTISDHRTVACLHDPRFLGAQTPLVLLGGVEWGGHGHAGAHGLTRAPVHLTQDESQGPAVAVAKIQDTIDDVHAMGGFFVVNHPIDTENIWGWPVDRFDGIEVWNQQWALRNTPDLDAAAVQRWAQDRHMTPGSGPQPMPELLAAVGAKGGGINWQRLKFYEAHLDAGRHVAALGGGDSHYLGLPGSPTTVVFARDRSVAAIVEGVRRGRTMVLRAPDAPVLDFTADRDQDGVFESMIGDSIPLGRPVTFKVRVRDCDRGMIDLVKNGRIVQRWAVQGPDVEVTCTDSASARSWYRVDCWEPLDLSVPYATTLKRLVLGTAGSSLGVGSSLLSILGNVSGTIAHYLGYVQDFMDAGGPAALFLVFYGDRMGVRPTPVATRFPRYEMPEAVSRILNVAIHQDDYCPGALTSPIWVE